MEQNSIDDYELPDEIDFSEMKRVPNPFNQNFQELNLVSLDADVKAIFPDSESVNTALRELIDAKKRSASEALAERTTEAA